MLHYNPNELGSITYGYVYEHDVFNKEELKQILSYCNLLPKEIGTVTKPSFAKNARTSNVSWVKRNNECEWFYDKLALHIDKLNQSFYQYDLTGFNDYQFTEYEALNKGKYDWHADMFYGQNEQFLTRKLSATLLLNDNFVGGNFEFYNLVEQPKMTAGTLIVFPSFMTHRVTEIIKGVRNSLVCWCVGPKFK